MNRVIDKLVPMPEGRERREKISPRESLEERKARMRQEMQERARNASPDLVARRREDREMLDAIKMQAQEALGIEPSNIGKEAKEKESRRMQDIAAKQRGYASAKEMQGKAGEEKTDFIEKAAKWLRAKFGIDIEPKDDKQEKNRAA